MLVDRSHIPQVNRTLFFVCFFRYPLLPDLISTQATFGSDFFPVNKILRGDISLLNSSRPVSSMYFSSTYTQSRSIGIFIWEHDRRIRFLTGKTCFFPSSAYTYSIREWIRNLIEGLDLLTGNNKKNHVREQETIFFYFENGIGDMIGFV